MKKKKTLITNLAKLLFALFICAFLTFGVSLNLNSTYASQVTDTDAEDEDDEGEQTVEAAPEDTEDVLDDSDFGADEGVTPPPAPTPSNNTSSGSQSSSTGSSDSSSGSNANKPAATTSSTTRSSDATLKYLAIVPGTLSPAFSPSVYDYTAVVDENVTSVKVPATPNDANACISQVTGAKTLTPGINRITVTVGAPDGSYKYYHIDVAVGSAAAADLANGVRPADATAPSDTAVAAPEEGDDAEEIVGSLDDVVEEETSVPSDIYFVEDGVLVYDGVAYISEDKYNNTSTVDLDKYNALYEQFQIEKAKFHRVVIVAVVVVLLLIFAIIGLALKLREVKAEDDGYDYVVKEKKEKPAKERPAKEKKEKPAKEKKEKPVKEKPVKEKPEAPKRSKLFDEEDDDDLEIIDLND
ncbi:MAG: cadherin-like beta sandwich domain-containing protein [Lachnospiraceae bacterium]|nr:cadherin-like beta sandwich domain-containing protein [Lachnospiraceae bacterium]